MYHVDTILFSLCEYKFMYLMGTMQCTKSIICNVPSRYNTMYQVDTIGKPHESIPYNVPSRYYTMYQVDTIQCIKSILYNVSSEYYIVYHGGPSGKVEYLHGESGLILQDLITILAS